MSSMVGYGQGSGSPYAVTKAAVNGLTVSLAAELGPRRIRVAVAPGFVPTPHLTSWMHTERQEQLISQQAIPVAGNATGIAAVIRFLVSPEAWMITGHTELADLGTTGRP
jgi:NAD(P)-dependent dehydrogenase (short-subunit alcohol dehydrogenase family)